MTKQRRYPRAGSAFTVGMLALLLAACGVEAASTSTPAPLARDGTAEELLARARDVMAEVDSYRFDVTVDRCALRAVRVVAVRSVAMSPLWHPAVMAAPGPRPGPPRQCQPRASESGRGLDGSLLATEAGGARAVRAAPTRPDRCCRAAAKLWRIGRRR